MRHPKVLFGCLAGMVLTFGACYAALHRAWLYEGGAIHDNGVVSYPRFVAPFASIPLNRPGRYSFKFKRFPAEQVVAMLNTPTAPRRETLETLTTRMAIHVEDQKGQLRCDASGFPAGTGQEQAFVTSAPVHATGIWLMGCNGFSVKNCNPCNLTVTISNVDPHTPAVPIVPSIQGGGIELP